MPICEIPHAGQPPTEKRKAGLLSCLRESASSYKVSAGDAEAVIRTHIQNTGVLSGFDERTGQPPTEKKKSRTFVLLSVGGDPEYIKVESVKVLYCCFLELIKISDIFFLPRC